MKFEGWGQWSELVRAKAALRKVRECLLCALREISDHQSVMGEYGWNDWEFIERLETRVVNAFHEAALMEVSLKD